MKTFATLALIGYATALRLKEPQGPPAGGDEPDITPEQFIAACEFLHENKDADPEVAAAWAQENLGFVPSAEDVEDFAAECILAAAEADATGSDVDSSEFEEACAGLAALKEAGLADDELLAAAREASGDADLTGDQLAEFGNLCLAAYEAAQDAPDAEGAAQIKEGDGPKGPDGPDGEAGTSSSEEPDTSDIEAFVEACEDLAEADEAGATWEDIAAGIFEATGEEVDEDDVAAFRGACAEAAAAFASDDEEGEGEGEGSASDIDTEDFEEACEAIWETKDWAWEDIQAAWLEETGEELEEEAYLLTAAACEAAVEAIVAEGEGDDE